MSKKNLQIIIGSAIGFVLFMVTIFIIRGTTPPPPPKHVDTTPDTIPVIIETTQAITAENDIRTIGIVGFDDVFTDTIEITKSFTVTVERQPPSDDGTAMTFVSLVSMAQVYEAPSYDSRLIATYSPGSTFVLVEDEPYIVGGNAWLHISTNGQDGWINAESTISNPDGIIDKSTEPTKYFVLKLNDNLRNAELPTVDDQFHLVPQPDPDTIIMSGYGVSTGRVRTEQVGDIRLSEIEVYVFRRVVGYSRDVMALAPPV